jgi:hypothetical protein
MMLRVMLAVAYATGRVSHVTQVKGDDPDEKGYPGPPGWGLGVRLTTPPHKKYCYETSRPTQGCRADDDDDDNDYDTNGKSIKVTPSHAYVGTERRRH